MPRTDADRRVHHPGRGHRPDPSAPPNSRHTRGASNARSARAVSAPRPAKRGEVRGPGRRSHRGATSVPACRALPAVTSNLEGKPARRMSRLSLLAGARVAGDHSLYSTRPTKFPIFHWRQPFGFSLGWLYGLPMVRSIMQRPARPCPVAGRRCLDDRGRYLGASQWKTRPINLSWKHRNQIITISPKLINRRFPA